MWEFLGVISRNFLSGFSAEHISDRDMRDWESGSLTSELGFCIVSRTIAATVRGETETIMTGQVNATEYVKRGQCCRTASTTMCGGGRYDESKDQSSSRCGIKTVRRFLLPTSRTSEITNCQTTFPHISTGKLSRKSFSRSLGERPISAS